MLITTFPRPDAARVPLAIPALLGVAHAAADGSAGWMLGSLAASRSPAELAAWFLLYNALGFASQPLVGWLVDRGRWARPAVLLGLAGQVVALVAVTRLPTLAIALAGLGSAFFHVGAGAIALNATPGRATGVGLFAAPGVLGLGVGGALAIAAVPASPFLVGLLLVLLAFLAAALPPSPAVARVGSAPSPRAVFEAHDLLVIGLLAAIALRSLVWTACTWIIEGQSASLLALTAAAAAGKVLGGPLADYFGWKRWSVAALLGAAVLACAGPTNSALVYLSAALLQSATPATVAALLAWLPGRPALTAGLAFGLAIAVGGAPFALGLGVHLLATPITAAALTLAAVLCALLLHPPHRAQPLVVPARPDNVVQRSPA
jgi:FSR family fosmidomycin resistance protein-like MFS transporter